MKQATPAVRNLARLLLALEANGSEHAEEEARAAISIFEKLRAYLSKLIGVTGFQALLARALALAKTEVGWLGTARVNADATLAGFSEAAQQQSAEVVVEGCKALLAQLLGLLVTFIGESLMLRLVQEVWPEARLADKNLDGEETTA